MRRDQLNVTKIQDLSGLYKTEPLIAGCLAVLFFSMAGIPPLAGFIGKLLILNIVIDNNLFFSRNNSRSNISDFSFLLYKTRKINVF